MRNCSLRVGISLALTVAIVGSAVGEGKLETRNVTQEQAIPAPVRYEFSRSVGPGRLVKAQEGHPGSLKRTYRIKTRDGKAVSKELIKEEKTEPSPTLMHMGRGGYQPSRSSFERSKVLTLDATAYDATEGGSRTRMGTHAEFGQVAVDPRVIPLGTLVFVEGYGFALASDTGSAIKGNRIDLCFNDRYWSTRYGHQMVKVHVFSKR